MATLENLLSVKRDYDFHEWDAREIHIVWQNGTKAGIGNSRLIKCVMDAIREELDRQIAENTNK